MSLSEEEAVRIATAALPPYLRGVLPLYNVFEHEDHFGVCFELPPHGRSILPALTTFIVDRTTKEATQFHGR